MPYYGTTHTLTECMRILEGWDVEKIPRLQKYVGMASFIESWLQNYDPAHRPEEWHLGREKSKELFVSKGTTNVREGIHYFWNHYLLQKQPKIADDDVEINIIDPRFASEKQPEFVLVGEDFLDLSGNTSADTYMNFHFFKSNSNKQLPLLKERNNKQLLTAELAREKYPEAKIIMFQYSQPQKRFTMVNANETKFEHNEMTYYLTTALRELM
jgi:hypothetical protein